jgi:hypothetical protein
MQPFQDIKSNPLDANEPLTKVVPKLFARSKKPMVFELDSGQLCDAMANRIRVVGAQFRLTSNLIWVWSGHL